MEKTYVIKVLAKKDAKLNYRPAIELTQRMLQKQLNTDENIKVTLRFKWYRPSQAVFENLYLYAVHGTKEGFKRYHDLFPDVEFKEVVSFKALYKAVMNIFVKVDDERLKNGDDLVSATDFSNFLVTIINEVVKTNFIKLSFYDKNRDNSKTLEFITHVLGGMCLGIAKWFGYSLIILEEGHALLSKIFMNNLEKIKETKVIDSIESINASLFLIDDTITYLEDSSYLTEEFNPNL
ncbi:hypothetical protein [Spiroplasma sp. DGKH1]|uniref:hypothetical protein n=1 Tax=Spiroplasma sp. DGKH1 TaxID=3050074 RepID=UPI0034C67692